jgi:hypothetical protein
MCEKYNGWANYETWAMELWNSNESGTDATINDGVYELVKNMQEDGEDDIDILTAAAHHVEELSQMFWKDAFDERNFNASYGPISDYVNSSWAMVNWHEIARHRVDAALEQLKEEADE